MRSGSVMWFCQVKRGKRSSIGIPSTITLPVPGWRRTRATDVFRPPTPVVPAVRCALVDLIILLAHLFVNLRLVRVLGARVDAKLSEHRSAERILGKHSTHGVLDNALGMAGQHRLEAHCPQRAKIAGMPIVHLLTRLVVTDDAHAGG